MKKEITVECDDLEWLYVPDILYAEYDDCKRYIQLLIPYRQKWETNEKYPLILFIPGSAWYCQEMYNSIPSYSKLAERGFVTAIVQYRESNIAKYPAQVQDINKAVQFLITKSEEFHIDTDKIFLAGNSSGGHIALMTAFRKANGIIDEENRCPFTIRGVIAESAPSDIFMCAAAKMPDFMPRDFRPSRDLLGVNEISDNIELAKEAGCQMYINADVPLPPVLLFHGKEDNQVHVEQSRQLYAQLHAAGKRVDYYEIAGCGHGGAVFWTEKVLDIIEQFITVVSEQV